MANNKSITLIKLGIANAYLIKAENGFILIDTGYSRKREELDKNLEELGVNENNLNLIILTHQDFDHSGNAFYMREKYHTRIAMHKEDAEAVERGDMLWNRKRRNIFTRILMKVLLVVLRLGKFETFTPDIYLEDGDNLAEYGLNSGILHLPGHSKGSIGILIPNKSLICGDLFMNTGKKPTKSSLVDVKEQLEVSIEKICNLSINTVYPGHGSPFELLEFKEAQHT